MSDPCQQLEACRTKLDACLKHINATANDTSENQQLAWLMALGSGSVALGIPIRYPSILFAFIGFAGGAFANIISKGYGQKLKRMSVDESLGRDLDTRARVHSKSGTPDMCTDTANRVQEYLWRMQGRYGTDEE